MHFKWDTALLATLAACALLTTGLVVRRELSFPAISPDSAAEEPRFIEDWRSHLAQGLRIGDPGAPVQLIEFADFECPFCAVFHESVKTVRERYPGQVSLTFMHLPLDRHRFALPAARVAECAQEQGRFEAMLDRLYTEQESFGLKPWTQYATQATVPDLPAFEACIESTAAIPRVESGKRLAAELAARGTPTVIVNGWQLVRPPTAQELDQMVKSVLSGKSPVARGEAL
jgi:protein-disulfide isomerase